MANETTPENFKRCEVCADGSCMLCDDSGMVPVLAVEPPLSIPKPAKLPDEFLPLIAAFAARATVSDDMVRDVLENVYRSGFTAGRLDGLATATGLAVVCGLEKPDGVA